VRSIERRGDGETGRKETRRLGDWETG